MRASCGNPCNHQQLQMWSMQHTMHLFLLTNCKVASRKADF